MNEINDEPPWPEEVLPKSYIPVLRIKKNSDTAKLPTKAHITDLGYDLYADEDHLVGECVTKIDTGISIGFPAGWGGLIKDRSSMASKGFMTVGGVIDNAYIGPLSVLMKFRHPTHPTLHPTFQIKKGDKIAQLVLTPVTNFPIEEVYELESTDRGEKGFGSSGT